MDKQGALVKDSVDGDWNNVLAISRAMLACARCDDWERVTELEAQRRLKLAAVFEDRPGQADMVGTVNHIQELLVIDKEIIHLGEDRRNHIGMQLRRIRKADSMRSTYRNWGISQHKR